MDIIPFMSEVVGDPAQQLGRQFYPIKYELETSDTEAGCCKCTNKLFIILDLCFD